MSFRLILLAGVAMTALAGGAARADTYRCGDSVCYDDQAEETRRLNEMQLENPGAGMDAVPDADDSYGPPDDDDDADDDRNGQGGPYYPVDPSDDSGYPPPPYAADQPDDDAYGPGDAPDTYQSDDDAYPDEGAPPDDGYDDDSDMPYPDEDDD